MDLRGRAARLEGRGGVRLPHGWRLVERRGRLGVPPGGGPHDPDEEPDAQRHDGEPERQVENHGRDRDDHGTADDRTSKPPSVMTAPHRWCLSFLFKFKVATSKHQKKLDDFLPAILNINTLL